MAPTIHFQRLFRWMEMEAKAEEAALLEQIQRVEASGADPEKSGLTLRALVIRDEAVGLGGRVIITLGKRNTAIPLPWNRFSPGTPVLLTEEGGASDQAWRGVVSRQHRESLDVALDKLPETEGDRATFRIDIASDEIARQRTRDALERVDGARNNRLSDLREILLGLQPPLFSTVLPFNPFDPNLDASQLDAIALALAAEDLAIVHGPPGTGKTTTVVELIRQAVANGERVLACAPSNLGVDNILERLLAAGVHAVRIGHPARVLPQLRDYTLDELVENHPDFKLAQKMSREAYDLRRRAGRFTRAKPEPGERQSLRDEASAMLKEARFLEDSLVERILSQAQVICSTTTGLNPQTLGRLTFDLGVIDEACQSTEPGTWIPTLWCRRLVLAGDHQQLPPTVVSQEAVRQGFGVSLMERLMEHDSAQFSRQLTLQYRMHQEIMQFSSEQFYKGTLEAHPSVAAHLLSDLPGVQSTSLTASPVEFIDTAGAGYEEELEPEGDSRFNSQEAALVQKKVDQLLGSGIPHHAIGVITPYSAQVRLLREMLPEGIEVNSVDGFQGREKEAVVISLVRSNTDGEIGFLADERRMNVAITRARRKLIVVGDSATIAAHPFYHAMLDYFDQINAYKSVWEEEYGS